MAGKKQLKLVLDEIWCYGCYTCEIACKQEHGLPAGPRLIRIEREGPKRINGRLQMEFKLATCRQCPEPDCVEACPEHAIAKREDGIVSIDAGKCNYCLICVDACPYGALQPNPDKQVVQKCELCSHRLAEGLQPACVSHCPIDALVVESE